MRKKFLMTFILAISMLFSNVIPFVKVFANSTYSVDFGNASWNILGNNVTASIAGQNLTNGFIDVSTSDEIVLTGFNSDFMAVEVSSSDGFRINLEVIDSKTNLSRTIDGVLPFDTDLYFNVVLKTSENYSIVSFGSGVWNINSVDVTATYTGTEIDNGIVYIANNAVIHLEGFDSGCMEARLRTQDGFSAPLYVDENGDTKIDNIGPDAHLPNDVLYFSVERMGADNGEENPPQTGNTTAIIRVNGVDGTYIEYGRDPETGEEYEREVPYDGRGAIANETKFNINDGAIWMLLPEGETEDNIGHYLYNEIEYQYNQNDGDTTVKLGLFTEWHLKFSDVIRVNGVDYQVSNYLNYDSSSSWLGHLNGPYVGFYLNVPIAEDNIYNITVKIDFNPIEYLSEFSWTNDPSREYREEHGEQVRNPEYISHAKLELVNVTYSVGGDEFSYDNFEYNFSDEYLSYIINHVGEYMDARLVVPSGATARVRITPEPGYQISNIILPDEFTVTDTPCEYEITIPNRIEDFLIEITERENIKANTNNDFVLNNIILPSSVIINGNFEFITAEANLDQSKINAFNNYAGNYTINTFVNISLNQIFNKAGSNNIWRNPINSINKKATVSLVLDEEIDADKIIVIYNTDGNNFETINPTVNNGVINFETKNFGNYAIASINLTEIESINISLDSPVSGEKVNVFNHHDDETGEDYLVADIVPNVVVANTENFTVERSYYANGTCSDDSNRCNEMFNGTFDQNNEYFVMIYIKAKDGYKFTSNSLSNILINDRSIDLSDEEEIFDITDNGERTRILVKISSSSLARGDFNGNGTVDLVDIVYLLRLYLGIEDNTPENIFIGDMNDNGGIDLSDIIILLRNYLGI